MRNSPTTLSARFLPAALAAFLLTGCLGLDGAGPKQTIGTLGGAVVGGLAGSEIGGGTGRQIMIGLGTLVGAAVGGSIGQSLDRADELYAERTAQRSLESAPAGQTVAWENPDSGNRGTITPTRTFEPNEFKRGEQRYCREFTQTIYVGGEEQTGVGTACRNPDGTWQLVSS